uniref:Uncharacterized protein n=1 Tax=Clastoptera arizonana TaxID=38151 RepID=A0A1B6CDE9_9HEMI
MKISLVFFWVADYISNSKTIFTKKLHMLKLKFNKKDDAGLPLVVEHRKGGKTQELESVRYGATNGGLKTPKQKTHNSHIPKPNLPKIAASIFKLSNSLYNIQQNKKTFR